MVKVVKFGGSSLANAAQYQKVIEILRADPERRIVVVSAPGKRFKDDVKVMDLLIKYANASGENVKVARQAVLDRYQEIADAYHVSDSDFEQINVHLIDLANLHHANKACRLAHFKAAGERLNAILMALVLKKFNVTARFVDPKQLGIKGAW